MSHFYTLYYTDESGELQEKDFTARNDSYAVIHVLIQKEYGQSVMHDIKLLDSLSNELTPSSGWF